MIAKSARCFFCGLSCFNYSTNQIQSFIE